MYIYRERDTHIYTHFIMALVGGRGLFCVDVQRYSHMHIHIGGGRGVFGVERRGGRVGR